jgi:hypothetical protein
MKEDSEKPRDYAAKLVLAEEARDYKAKLTLAENALREFAKEHGAQYITLDHIPWKDLAGAACFALKGLDPSGVYHTANYWVDIATMEVVGIEE